MNDIALQVNKALSELYYIKVGVRIILIFYSVEPIKAKMLLISCPI